MKVSIGSEALREAPIILSLINVADETGSDSSLQLCPLRCVTGTQDGASQGPGASPVPVAQPSWELPEVTGGAKHLLRLAPSMSFWLDPLNKILNMHPKLPYWKVSSEIACYVVRWDTRMTGHAKNRSPPSREPVHSWTGANLHLRGLAEGTKAMPVQSTCEDNDCYKILHMPYLIPRNGVTANWNFHESVFTGKSEKSLVTWTPGTQQTGSNLVQDGETKRAGCPANRTQQTGSNLVLDEGTKIEHNRLART